MSLLSTLARMEAVRDGRAVPLATVRHRHLADRPMVLVPLAAAGEAGAPLAVMLGQDRESPVLLTVPQPLDRDRRFALLADLAAELLPWLEGFGTEVDLLTREVKDPATGEKTEQVRELCTNAPQLLVPGPAAVEFLGLLGRSTRFRRSAETALDEGVDPGPYPVPARVPLLGRWLTHLRDRAQVPGSSLLLAMTDLLGRHWATGQSRLEDQHLGALLAWIDPPAGRTGAEAALLAETARDGHGQLLCPPAGPTTDPRFDSGLLAPAITRYDAARKLDDAVAAQAREAEIAALLEAVLRPTWDRLWQGLDLLRALPAAAHLPERWEGDRWSYTSHRDRIAAGEPPQPVRDDAVTAARKLAQREREQTRLDIQEALDDPLAMAEHRLAGEALAGRVVAVEAAYDETGRSPKPRPLVTVRTSDRPHGDPGRELYRAGGPTAQKAELVSADPAAGLVTVRLLNGMGRRKEPEPGSVPEPGEQVCFTLFELTARQSAPLPEPEDTPWTHGGPPVTRTATAQPDLPTAPADEEGA
ncbi:MULTISPECIES: hypothetical protein [Streptacidiphilus]|uniref:Uncharacterized protein n=1 Tax=Streptacidiphilus cavernicola TaxID=3342716 RepID=A0ABV6UEG2_9ACTN|nr:hypothetical protein [Streptacidiphilus jeojiense]